MTTTPAPGSPRETDTHGRTERRPVAAHIAAIMAHLTHRWPTLLAIAFAALLLSDADADADGGGGGDSGGSGPGFALVLLIAAVTYLTTSVVDRPRAVWGVLAVLLAGVVLMRVVGVDAGPVLAGAALVLVVAGLARGQLRRAGLYALQVPAVLAFGALALWALRLPPDTGLLLVAAGLIGHAVWDAAHMRGGRIVVRPFAEWCGVLDLALGVGLLILA